jgi:hypothetical protein
MVIVQGLYVEVLKDVRGFVVAIMGRAYTTIYLCAIEGKLFFSLWTSINNIAVNILDIRANFLGTHTNICMDILGYCCYSYF